MPFLFYEDLVTKSYVKIDLPSTWPKYHKGMCDGCWGGCCTLPLEVSLADLMRMKLVTENEAASTAPKKIAARLTREGYIKSYRTGTQIFTIEQRNGRDCIFLHEKTRLCTIYERRPEVCRQFPKIGPRPGHCPKTPK